VEERDKGHKSDPHESLTNGFYLQRQIKDPIRLMKNIQIMELRKEIKFQKAHRTQLF
jgi:hypothetical protein